MCEREAKDISKFSTSTQEYVKKDNENAKEHLSYLFPELETWIMAGMAHTESIIAS